MSKTVTLDPYDLELIRDLLTGYRDGIESGEIVDDINTVEDIDETLRKLKD